MVFKRPRNSRDDSSGRSSNRTSNSGERPKRATSSGRNSGPASEKSESRSSGSNYRSGDSSEKKSFSSYGKKPFQSKAESSEKSPSSFTGAGGERSTFKSRKTPYTGRTADNDSGPKRSFGNTGDKKPFGAAKKPYSGRFTEGDDRPKSRISGASPAGKRPASTGAKSFGTPYDPDNRPSSASRAGKRPSAPGGKSFGTPYDPDNRPKRDTYKKTTGDKPYSTDRPQRAKPVYDKIRPDPDAPVKTLRGRKKGPEVKETGLIRLNRYISNAGICSRRKADELIAAGVVSVNGVVVSELGQKVDPQKDEIRYNGELLKREKMVYVLLNKPKDYITTTEDPHERRTVMHLVEKASKERIYPIGRLDRNTTGLLLMTNDGDLADKLSHPKNNISKLYQVELSKSLTQGDMNKIGFGLELEDGLIKPDSISYVAGGSKREVGIQIHSGKNRIVRRIFEHLGYEVVKLDRVVYANLTKKDLPRGRWRYLEESEIIQLKHLI